MQSENQNFFFKLTFVLLAIFLLGYLAIIGKTLLAPLCFALLLAFLLLPLSNFLEHKLKGRRSLATSIAVFMLLLVVYAVGHFFAIQLTELWTDWPLLVRQVTDSFHHLQTWIADEFKVNISKQETYLADSVEKILSNSGLLIGKTISTLSSSLLFLFFTLLFTFFILNYRRLLYRFIQQVFLSEHRSRVVETVHEVQEIIKKYTIGLFFQMLIVSTLITLILSILGVKYAILLGLFAGIFNVIPYLGISVAALISMMITFATADGGQAFLVMLAFVGVHAIDGNIVLPLIVGSKVKINALIAFIGIVVGEMIWGIQGMFLCMPYLAILNIIFKKVEGLAPWAILLDEEEPIRHTTSSKSRWSWLKRNKKAPSSKHVKK